MTDWSKYKKTDSAPTKEQATDWSKYKVEDVKKKEPSEVGSEPTSLGGESKTPDQGFKLPENYKNPFEDSALNQPPIDDVISPSPSKPLRITSKEVGGNSNQGMGEENWKALKSASIRTVGGIEAIPALINNTVFEFIQKPIMKLMGSTDEDIDQQRVINKLTPIGTLPPTIVNEQVQQKLNKAASNIEATMKQYEGGIVENIQNGNYGDATRQLTKGVTQSLPYLAMVAATSGGGTPAVLSTMGVASAAQRQGDIEEQGLMEGKYGKQVLNSWMYGGFEAAGELFTMGIFNNFKRALVGASKETIKKSATQIATGFLKEFGGESSSEMVTDLGQQLTDYFQGNIDKVDFKQTFDAGIVGGFATAPISGGTAVLNSVKGSRVASKKDVETVQNNQAKIVDLKDQLNDTDAPIVKQTIEDEIKKTETENEKIIEKNIDKAKDLNIDDITAIDNVNKAIDEYTQKIIEKKANKEDFSAEEQVIEALNKKRDEILSAEKAAEVKNGRGKKKTEVQKKSDVVYSAVFVDKDELIKEYGQTHPNVHADHSTIEFKPKDTSNLPIGESTELKVTGRLTTDKVDVLLVENPLSKNKYPHITLSTAEGVKPFESNAEIENNLDKIVPTEGTIKGNVNVFENKKVETPEVAVPDKTAEPVEVVEPVVEPVQKETKGAEKTMFTIPDESGQFHDPVTNEQEHVYSVDKEGDVSFSNKSMAMRALDNIDYYMKQVYEIQNITEWRDAKGFVVEKMPKVDANNKIIEKGKIRLTQEEGVREDIKTEDASTQVTPKTAETVKAEEVPTKPITEKRDIKTVLKEEVDTSSLDPTNTNWDNKPEPVTHQQLIKRYNQVTKWIEEHEDSENEKVQDKLADTEYYRDAIEDILGEKFDWEYNEETGEHDFTLKEEEKPSKETKYSVEIMQVHDGVDNILNSFFDRAVGNVRYYDEPETVKNPKGESFDNVIIEIPANNPKVADRLMGVLTRNGYNVQKDGQTVLVKAKEETKTETPQAKTEEEVTPPLTYDTLIQQMGESNPGLIGKAKAGVLGALVRAAAKVKGMTPDEYVAYRFNGIVKGGEPAMGALYKSAGVTNDEAIEKYLSEHPETKDDTKYHDAVVAFLNKLVGAAAGSSAIKANGKTILSIDISANCPLREIGSTCPQCYVDKDRDTLLSNVKKYIEGEMPEVKLGRLNITDGDIITYYDGDKLVEMGKRSAVSELLRSKIDPVALKDLKVKDAILVSKDGKKVRVVVKSINGNKVTVANIKQWQFEVKGSQVIGKSRYSTGLALSPTSVYSAAPFKDSDILNMPQPLVDFFNNQVGGLRVFSNGDYKKADTKTLDRVVKAAEKRGLKLKVVTKQPEMVERYGKYKHVYFNLSVQLDPKFSHVHKKAISKKLKEFGYNKEQGEAIIQKFEATLEAGALKWGWKMADVVALKKDNPRVRLRYVAMNKAEYIASVIDPNIDVLTMYHGATGAKQMFEGWENSMSHTTLFAPTQEGGRGLDTETIQALASIFEQPKAKNIAEGKAITQKEIDDVLGEGKLTEKELVRLAEKKTCCIDGACGKCSVLCGFANAMRTKDGLAVLTKFLNGEVRASVEFDSDNRALIRAIHATNVTDMVHELGHVFRRDLSPADLKVAENWAGVKDGVWTREAEEKFAMGFEKYVSEGVAPTKELKSVFEKLKAWFAEIYKTLNESAPDVELSDDIRGVFDRMLGKEKKSDSQPKAVKGSKEKSIIQKITSLPNHRKGIGNVEYYDQPKSFTEPFGLVPIKNAVAHIELLGRISNTNLIKDLKNAGLNVQAIGQDLYITKAETNAKEVRKDQGLSDKGGKASTVSKEDSSDKVQQGKKAGTTPSNKKEGLAVNDRVTDDKGRAGKVIKIADDGGVKIEFDNGSTSWTSEQEGSPLKLEQISKVDTSPVAEKLNSIAEKIREGKISRIQGFKSNSPMGAIWDSALEILATTLEATADLTVAISKALDYIKSTQWYKDLTADKQTEFSEKFVDHIENELGKEYGSATNHNFINPEVQERFDNAVMNHKSWIQKRKEELADLRHKILRSYKDLPKNKKFAEAFNAINTFEKAVNIASGKAGEGISRILGNMKKGEYNLFTKKVIFDDLWATITLNPEYILPYGLTKDTLREELDNINMFVAYSSKVREALERRKEFYGKIQKEYSDWAKKVGINTDGYFDRNDYFRHQVLLYSEMSKLSDKKGRPLNRPKGSDLFKHRNQGKGYDINRNYIEAEFEVFNKLNYAIEKMKMIDNIYRNYDIMAKLRAEGKKALGEDATKGKINQWVEDNIPEGYVLDSPENMNIFMASSIPQALANDLLLGNVDQVGIKRDDLRKIFALGASKKIVIPVEIYNTLDNVSRAVDNRSNFAKSLLTGWKIWTLIQPKRLLKYNIRNLTGDAEAVFLGNARVFKKMPESVKELYDVLVKGKEPSPEMKEYISRGGMQLVLTTQEISQLKKIKEFEKYYDKKRNAFSRGFDKYWETAKTITDFREQLLRYAAYKEWLSEIEKNGGEVKNYGASNPEFIDGLKDPHDKAFRLSNELLGAYDQISEAGKNLRSYWIPFWSFQEINFRRTNQMFMNSMRVEKNLSGKTLKGLEFVAKKTPVVAFNMAKLAIKLSGFWAMTAIWNGLLFSDEEDQLPEEIKSRPHIIFGRNPDGTVRYLSRLGVMGDYLEWFGLDGFPMMINEFLSGRMSPKDIAKDMAISPANKIIQGANPFLKTGAELITRKSLFPDFTKPRIIRDYGEQIAINMGLKDEYRAVSNLPDQPYYKSLRKMFWDEIDPMSTSYWTVLSYKYKFLKKEGKASTESYTVSDKSLSLYYYKQALTYGDVKSAEHYLERYISLGGTKEGYELSMSFLNPMKGLKSSEKEKFKKFLGKENEKELEQAMEYYEKILNAKMAWPSPKKGATEVKEEVVKERVSGESVKREESVKE